MNIYLKYIIVFIFFIYSIPSLPWIALGTENDASQETTLEGLVETSLDILLIGTAPGGGGQGFAIILDSASNTQMICQVGDYIQGAKIRQVYREQVVLDINGEIQVLSFSAPRQIEPVPAEQILTETELEATNNLIGYASEVFIQRDNPPAGQPDKKMPVRRIIFKGKQTAAP